MSTNEERKMKDEIVYGWHFLPTDKRLRYRDGRKVTTGKTLSVTGCPQVTVHGLHSSRSLTTALRYAPCPILCRVASWGRVHDFDDLAAAQNRHIVWMIDADKVLREHAAWCAQWALEQEAARAHEVDPRSHAAVEAAFAFSRGEITRKQLGIASRAAYDAYSDAFIGNTMRRCGPASHRAYEAAHAACTTTAVTYAARAAQASAASSALLYGVGVGAQATFNKWLLAAVLDAAESQGVYREDYDPRGGNEPSEVQYRGIHKADSSIAVAPANDTNTDTDTEKSIDSAYEEPEDEDA
jgi:hypothetical protein